MICDKTALSKWGRWNILMSLITSIQEVYAVALSSTLISPWNSPYWCSNFIISMKPQLRSSWGGLSKPKSSEQPQTQPTSVRATGGSFAKATRSSRHRVFARSFLIAGIHSKGASHHGSNKLFNCVTHLTATFSAFREEISLQWATLIRCIFRAILFGDKTKLFTYSKLHLQKPAQMLTKTHKHTLWHYSIAIKHFADGWQWFRQLTQPNSEMQKWLLVFISFYSFKQLPAKR